MEQVASILVETERMLAAERPDRVLILGDTNSALSSIVAKRFGIPVYHMEAGNRCFDDRVPEEVNRRIVDHSSDVLLPYTERSRANLLREGIASERIHVTGNPINEVLDFYAPQIDGSDVLARLGLDVRPVPAGLAASGRERRRPGAARRVRGGIRAAPSASGRCR